MAEPDFWNHSEKAAAVIARIKAYKSKVDKYKAIADEFEDLKLMLELLQEEEDTSLAAEIPDKYEKLVGHLEVLRIETLLDDKYDANNAIVPIRAGGLRHRTDRKARGCTRWAERGATALRCWTFRTMRGKKSPLLVEGKTLTSSVEKVHRLRIVPDLRVRHTSLPCSSLGLMTR